MGQLDSLCGFRWAEVWFPQSSGVTIGWSFSFKPKWKLTLSQDPKAVSIRFIFKTETQDFDRDDQGILSPKQELRILPSSHWYTTRQLGSENTKWQMRRPNAIHINVLVFLCKVRSDKGKHFLKVPFGDIKQASNVLPKYRGTLTFEPQEFCFPSCFSLPWLLQLNSWNC